MACSSIECTSPRYLTICSWMVRSVMVLLSSSRLEYDLDRAVSLLLEQLVGVRCAIEREPVRRQIVDAERVVVAGQQRHDLVGPAPDMRLAHPDLNALVEELHHRHRVELSAVDATDRERSAASDGVDAFVQNLHAIHAELLDRLLGDRVG